MIVMDEDTCMVELARYFLNFTQEESCGKCVPCRIGTLQMVEILTRITEGQGQDGDIDRLEQLARTIKAEALCGLGQTAPNPVVTTLRYFRHEYEAHISQKTCPASVCRALVQFRIIPEKCTGCGRCAISCPTGAITGSKKEVHSLDVTKCVKCRACYKAVVSAQWLESLSIPTQEERSHMPELPETVAINMDGKALSVKKGLSILEVAKQHNIYIPTLCAHKDLSPFGGCRLCIVEIEGKRGFATACTTPAESGMVIRTRTAAVRAQRIECGVIAQRASIKLSGL